MGVDDHANIDAKGVAKNHVGGFACNAGQRNQRFEFLRDVTLVVLHQQLCGPVQEFGFVAMQSDGFDVFPDRFG